MILLTYEEALSSVLQYARLVESQRVQLAEAVGRYASESVFSATTLPRFDNSQMDGYAVRSRDLQSATIGSPVVLETHFTASAGEQMEMSLPYEKAARIFTGAPLPNGADAVVPIEDVTVEPGSDLVAFYNPVDLGQFVRTRGEDVAEGDLLISAGRLIRAGEIALLASTGNSEVSVYRQARVAILINGDELVRPQTNNQPLKHGQIYESNSLMLAVLVKQTGAVVVGSFSTEDSRDSLRIQIETIVREHAPDLIVSTGGVSVGDRDYIRSVIQDLGEIVFWRAAIRPGKPIVYGRIFDVHFLGLPGNPASTMVTFELFARPLLSRIQGGSGATHTYPTTLTGDVRHDPDRRSFVRAHTELTPLGLLSTPLAGQGSHFITSLAGSNSLIVLKEDVTDLAAGSAAECLLLGRFPE